MVQHIVKQIIGVTGRRRYRTQIFTGLQILQVEEKFVWVTHPIKVTDTERNNPLWGCYRWHDAKPADTAIIEGARIFKQPR